LTSPIVDAHTEVRQLPTLCLYLILTSIVLQCRLWGPTL